MTMVVGRALRPGLGGHRLLGQSARFILALACMAVLVTGCSDTSAKRDEALPPGPAEVTVTAEEFRFEYNPAIPAGRVVFHVQNTGRLVHRPTLVPLPEEFPPIDAQLRGPVRRPLTPFAGTPFRPPGTSGAMAVDLVAGRRYAFICFLEDQDGVPHAVKGMNSEFRADGSIPNPSASAPAAKL